MYKKVRAFIKKNGLDLEGKYADSPYDAGGKTMYGITKWTALRHGWFKPMKKLPIHKAYEIYEKAFYRPLKLSYFEDQKIAGLLFTIAIHCGMRTGAKMFQRILNVLNREETDWKDIKVDGKIGNITLGCFHKAIKKRYRAKNILKSLYIIYGYEKMIELAENPKRRDEFNINGWLAHRIKLGK